MKLRLSYGSARFLGLIKSGPILNMKTIYTLFGEKCTFDCAYCAQARTSRTSEGMLSRVVWPKFEMGDVVKAIERSSEVKRICLQIVSSKGVKDEAFYFLRSVRNLKIPISASVRILSEKEGFEWFEQGVERLGIATDVVDEKLYELYRGGELKKHVSLLKKMAEKFPSRITTHVIVGMGESEKQMVEFIQKMHDIGVTVGLFAFTPIKGTKLENHPKPSIHSYRRIQIARYLIEENLANVKDFKFSEVGEITDSSFDMKNIPDRAFMTSGCPDCTRPYYNEEPGKESYNFFDSIKRTSFVVGDRKV